MARGGKNLTEVNPQEIEEITKSPTFVHRPTTSNGKEFFYFRKIGDSIEGFLGRSIDNTKIQRTKSFIIQTENGIEEFFASGLLQRLLRNLDGKYIQVVYIGDQYTGFGHRKKIYRVFKDVGLRKKMVFAGDTEHSKTQNRKGKKDGSKQRTKKRANGSSTGDG